MRRSFTSKDIEVLRNHCRMGIVISFLVFILTSVVGIVIFESMIDGGSEGINSTMALLVAAGTLLISIMMNLLIYYKYYIDLQIGEKVMVVRTLMNKGRKIDSAGGMANGVLKAYAVRYEFVVDDITFSVDEELFQSCSEGDELFFSYAPKSQYLLSIEKRNSHHLK